MNNPFIVDHETRSITKFGQPCLVLQKEKPRALAPGEFDAAALLIEHMGQYVAIKTLCLRLQCDPARVQRIMGQLRQALGLGSSHNLRDSPLVLMSDGSPARGYGIFVIPRHDYDHTPDALARGTREALLSDLEPEASLIELPADDGTLVVRLEGQVVRLHIGGITGRTPAQIHVTATAEPARSGQADDAHGVMIGWDRSRGVYGIKRLGRPATIGDALLDEARTSGLAHSLDSSADVANGMFTVECTLAAQPANLATALKRYLEHQRSQTEGIPSNVTTHRDVQAMILDRLGATQQRLLGVNPLLICDSPAPFPSHVLLYVNRIMPHGARGALGIRPVLAGHKQGLATSFYQREGVATLVFGLYEHDGTMLVAAWDPANHPALRNTVLSVDEETLRLAKQRDGVVNQSRHKLAKGRSEQVLVAPLEHLDKLIEARLRTDPKQRMIDALGGNSRVQAHLNAHTWTMAIDERLFHIQWCGPLLRGDASSHIRPFSVADRFVAPDADAVVLYAGHDPRNDVVVLWRDAPEEHMYERKAFSVPDSIVDEAARIGMVTHVTQAGNKQVVFREAVAATYETAPLTSALRYLSREQDHQEIRRSPNTSVYESLSEQLRPVEGFDRERSRTRPWPITVDLPGLGKQSLDVFAYRAQTSRTRDGRISIAIRPFVRSVGERTSLFVAGREPILLGEWEGIYILFDPRVLPAIAQSQRISTTVSPDHLEAVRKRGLARMTRSLEHGAFEETLVFATEARLLDALDLRLRTLPKANLELIRKSLDMSDPRALAEMATRLQRALRLPDRDALTGTRDVPQKMIVVTGAPDGIKVIAVENEIRRALRTRRTTDDAALLRLHSDDTKQAVLLHAGLRAVLQTDEAPRWPVPERFDVLWTLMHSAAHDGTISDEFVQIACRNSLQWLFIGKRAPFEQFRHEEPGSYRVRLRHGVVGIGREHALAQDVLDRVFNHASLYASPRARPDIVWAFIKKVGRAGIVPMASADDVVFERDGQRIWVYGLTKTLRRSEDGQTDYVAPALSPAQLSRILAHPGDQHVLAAFDPTRGDYAWVFWSARPHVERLHDPDYRLHVGANLPDDTTQEWRQLDDNHEERVAIYLARRRRASIPTLFKQLAAELAQDRLASFEEQASKSGLTLGQVLAVMKPVHQISMAMRYGLAPYDRRHSMVEIKDIMGYNTVPTSTVLRHAADRARACLDAGEPLAELAEIIGLLHDPRAEQFMDSPILYTMLRELHGLEPDAKPASFARVFGDRGLNAHVWHALYRELVMRLIRGANKHGVSTTASFDIGTAVRAGALPGATQIEIEAEADPATPPSTQPAVVDGKTPESDWRVARDEMAAVIALPDSESLEASYTSAIAALRQARGEAWPPDVTLPVALSRLPPDVELIMRAYLGVWPYPRRYTLEQVTAEFNIRTPARSRLLIRLASDELLAHAELSSGRIFPASGERPTLERLAALLTHRADVLTDDELNAVLARHGLATAAPLVTETTRQGALSEFRPSRQYRGAIKRMTGDVVRTTKTDDDSPYWQPEQIAEIYKRIDAGEYAKLLLLLRDPATRDETFSDMVLRSVAAAGRRASHRSSALQGRRMNTMEERQTSLSYEDAVTRTLGFDPGIDTFLQRADKLDAVLDRALAITDEEAPLLQRIVDDGRLTYNEFLRGNMRLAYSAARRSGYVDNESASIEILDDAISGLQRAIWGYDPKMSASFANYGFSVIRSTILRQSAIRYAQRLDIPIPRAQEIMMTRIARNHRRKQATANGQPRQPTLEELARAVLEPLLRRRLVAQLKTEPTATQLRAGWRRYMPEFLRRIEENIELVDRYDRVTRAASFDRGYSLRDGDDFTLYDVVASAQQSTPAIPGDEPDYPALADDLEAALDRAGLTEQEQFVLRHHFGLTGYAQLPMGEIAERRSVGEHAVDETITSAVAKIRQSAEALALLTPYLRQ